MSVEAPRTLSELATHLGLSEATVSFVLNGRARKMRISPRTETRILEASRAFGFQPNRVAASLRSGRTGSVGLVVPDIANPFFASLAQQIERRLRAHGMAVLLSDSAESVEVEEASLEDLRQRRVDGLIIAPVGPVTPALEAVSEGNFPVVCVDRILPRLTIPQVSTDHADAARQAVTQLLAQGHRRIGCLRGQPGIHSDDERVRGYREALTASGIEAAESWIAGGSFMPAVAMEEAIRLLARGEITAIVPLAGQITLGLLEALRRSGKRCPDDVSIVAFDEQPWSGLVSPPLTTVRQPIEEMAAETVHLLKALIQGQSSNAVVKLPSRLVERASIQTLAPS